MKQQTWVMAVGSSWNRQKEWQTLHSVQDMPMRNPCQKNQTWILSTLHLTDNLQDIQKTEENTKDLHGHMISKTYTWESLQNTELIW